MDKIDFLLSSREIIDKAIVDYDPYATVLMLSGGDDSMATLEACKMLGVKIDFIMHGVTGTGIKETYDFVKQVVSKEPSKYLEANAGDAYVKYVLRKGFFGVGNEAHNFTYHLLKWTHFRRTVSQEIRHRKRKRNILFINGGRRLESANREKMFLNPIKVMGSNIWVNLINEWPNNSPADFLEQNSVARCPVSKLICRSGECNCGSTLQVGDRVEISYHFPDWGKWIDDLSKAVKANGFDWEWGQSMPQNIAMEKKGQLNLFKPLCQTCIVNYDQRTNG